VAYLILSINLHEFSFINSTFLGGEKDYIEYKYLIRRGTVRCHPREDVKAVYTEELGELVEL
jgi:hypothetical protein